MGSAEVSPSISNHQPRYRPHNANGCCGFSGWSAVGFRRSLERRMSTSQRSNRVRAELQTSKKSLSGLGEAKFYLGTLLDARLKPTSDCKSTTTQILFTIGEGQIKYQTPSVTLFRQEHPNRCLCLGVR